MTKVFYFLITFVLIASSVFAQNELPIVKANSKVLDIRDGDDFQKGNWHISPEIRPDVYNVERFKGHKKVTFITDIDSISFDVEPQQTYDFVILLNNRDSAYTQFSTKTPKGLRYTSKRQYDPDTLPFTLGWNNSIRIKGKINNSDLLDLIFDTGANGFVLSSDVMSKNVSIKIDGEAQGFGLGGASNDKISNSNRLEISGLEWDSVSMLVKYQGKPNADGVIGYNVFNGKLVEIDYDKNIMIIHPKLPADLNGYTSYSLNFRGGLSFIELTLQSGTTNIKGLFDFDTGSSSTLFLNKDFTTRHGIFSLLKKSGSDNIRGSGPNKVKIDHLILAKLQIGGITLSDIKIDAESNTVINGTPFNIIGNDILKRFNVILDYQNDVVYLKPNSLLSNMYLSQKISLLKWSASLLTLALLITGFAVYKRRKSRQLTK